MDFSREPTFSLRCTSTRARLCCVMVRMVLPWRPIIAPTISLWTKMRSGKSACRPGPGMPGYGLRWFRWLRRWFLSSCSACSLLPSNSTPFRPPAALWRLYQKRCGVMRWCEILRYAVKEGRERWSDRREIYKEQGREGGTGWEIHNWSTGNGCVCLCAWMQVCVF